MASLGELHDLDLERGLPATLQQVVMAARTMFGADGAGIMLADGDGELRRASATDQQSQLVQEDQARLGRGPSHAAFSQRQVALGHGALIEQAKGVLMEREHLDAATAYERLRAAARSTSRKVVDLAREVLAGVPPPPGGS